MLNKTSTQNKWSFQSTISPILLVVGSTSLALCGFTKFHLTQHIASETAQPFLLVGGLIILGKCSDSSGLFRGLANLLPKLLQRKKTSIAGHDISDGLQATSDVQIEIRFIVVLSICLSCAITSALLNLDTAVIFLTPILFYSAKKFVLPSRYLLVTTILMSNCGSLLLSGSNLTNLMILRKNGLSGHALFENMLMPWLACIVIVSFILYLFMRDCNGYADTSVSICHTQKTSYVGQVLCMVSVVGAIIIMLTFNAPGIAVLVIALLLSAIFVYKQFETVSSLLRSVNIQVMLGLFGLATSFRLVGTITHTAIASYINHSQWESILVGTGMSIAINNLPAAGFLAAHHSTHPYALLVGLDVGPNLFLTGSLSWLLWLQSIRDLQSTGVIRLSIKLGFLTGLTCILVSLGLLECRNFI